MNSAVKAHIDMDSTCWEYVLSVKICVFFQNTGKSYNSEQQIINKTVLSTFLNSARPLYNLIYLMVEGASF